MKWTTWITGAVAWWVTCVALALAIYTSGLVELTTAAGQALKYALVVAVAFLAARRPRPPRWVMWLLPLSASWVVFYVAVVGPRRRDGAAVSSADRPPSCIEHAQPMAAGPNSIGLGVQLFAAMPLHTGQQYFMVDMALAVGRYARIHGGLPPDVRTAVREAVDDGAILDLKDSTVALQYSRLVRLIPRTGGFELWHAGLDSSWTTCDDWLAVVEGWPSFIAPDSLPTALRESPP